MRHIAIELRFCQEKSVGGKEDRLKAPTLRRGRGSVGGHSRCNQQRCDCEGAVDEMAGCSRQQHPDSPGGSHSHDPLADGNRRAKG